MNSQYGITQKEFENIQRDGMGILLGYGVVTGKVGDERDIYFGKKIMTVKITGIVPLEKFEGQPLANISVIKSEHFGNGMSADGLLGELSELLSNL